MVYRTFPKWYPSRLTPVPDRLRCSAITHGYPTAEALKAGPKAEAFKAQTIRPRPKRPRPSMRQRP